MEKRIKLSVLYVKEILAAVQTFFEPADDRQRLVFPIHDLRHVSVEGKSKIIYYLAKQSEKLNFAK